MRLPSAIRSPLWETTFLIWPIFTDFYPADDHFMTDYGKIRKPWFRFYLEFQIIQNVQHSFFREIINVMLRLIIDQVN